MYKNTSVKIGHDEMLELEFVIKEVYLDLESLSYDELISPSGYNIISSNQNVHIDNVNYIQYKLGLIAWSSFGADICPFDNKDDPEPEYFISLAENTDSVLITVCWNIGEELNCLTGEPIPS